MDEKQDATRCKQCDHLNSFHGEDGCGTWLLGVRAVPLYRCACVVSAGKSLTKFPTITPSKLQLPAPKPYVPTPTNDVSIAKLTPASEASVAAQANLRLRLNDLAEGLRRTAAELKNLEDTLDNTLRRLTSNKQALPNSPPANANTSPGLGAIHSNPSAQASAEHFMERRASNDRRRRHYAMIAERRNSDRRTVAA